MILSQVIWFRILFNLTFILALSLGVKLGLLSIYHSNHFKKSVFSLVSTFIFFVQSESCDSFVVNNNSIASICPLFNSSIVYNTSTSFSLFAHKGNFSAVRLHITTLLTIPCLDIPSFHNNLHNLLQYVIVFACKQPNSIFFNSFRTFGLS